MERFTFSFKKFNKIFLKRSLLLSIPGIFFVISICLACFHKPGVIIDGNAHPYIAGMIIVFIIVSVLVLLLIPPYYLSNFSLFRLSYIEKNGENLKYYKVDNEMPILDERTKIYDIKDIESIEVKNKKIYIKGNITEVWVETHGMSGPWNYNLLKIPDVFKNTEKLKKHE